MFYERDQRCTAVQLKLSTNPSYDNRTIASTLKMQIRMVQRLRAQLNASNNPLEVVERKPKAEAPPGRPGPRSSSKRSRQSLMKLPSSVVIPRGNQVAGSRPWVWQQDSAPAHKSKETQAWLQKECYDFVSFSHWPPLLPRPEPAGLLCLVIHWEHHQHDLPQHQRQPDHHHPLSIRRAPASACGKGMLPVLDLYQGSDWGWRWLHWIDVSSTT